MAETAKMTTRPCFMAMCKKIFLAASFYWFPEQRSMPTDMKADILVSLNILV
jgi:hypothetical protein